jgi:superfamily II DNA/RNA helicase
MAGKPFSTFPELSTETLEVLQSQGLTRATPVQVRHRMSRCVSMHTCSAQQYKSRSSHHPLVHPRYTRGEMKALHLSLAILLDSRPDAFVQLRSLLQEATIPLFARNKDVAVDACTGSGKTLAFILPVIERLRRLEEPLRPHQVGEAVWVGVGGWALVSLFEWGASSDQWGHLVI